MRNKQKVGPKSKPRHVAELLRRVLPGAVTRSGKPATGASQSALLPAANVSLEWREILQKALDPELRPHITDVLAKPRELVVFTESAAWCTRLKLVLAELERTASERDPGINKVLVRVRPHGAAGR